MPAERWWGLPLEAASELDDGSGLVRTHFGYPPWSSLRALTRDQVALSHMMLDMPHAVQDQFQVADSRSIEGAWLSGVELREGLDGIAAFLPPVL